MRGENALWKNSDDGGKRPKRNVPHALQRTLGGMAVRLHQDWCDHCGNCCVHDWRLDGLRHHHLK
jgi:hypothetical protein